MSFSNGDILGHPVQEKNLFQLFIGEFDHHSYCPQDNTFVGQI